MYQFLLYEPIHEAGLAVLQEVGQVRMASATDEDTIISEIQDVDGVVIRARGAMTRRILEQAPRLKVVGRHGVGVDNIDLAAAAEFGVQIVYTPQATVEPVAEHAVGLMLALSKGIVYADRQLRAGHFEVRYDIQGQEMRGRTLGAIGFGRIGQRVAEILHKAFEMPVLYYDVLDVPQAEQALGARRVPLNQVLAAADYITVHVPLLPQTRHMIGEEEFALMQPSALFVNTSRGPVVDETALYHALRDRRIAGAAIDVYEQEPTPTDNPLLALDNIIVTPHIASSTKEALLNMSLVTQDIVAVLQGRAPAYPVTG